MRQLALGVLCCFALLQSTGIAQEFSFQGLGDLPGGEFKSRAQGISADGSTVVGSGQTASGEEAFRWTRADGMEGLGRLADATSRSYAAAASADGSIIVGSSYSPVGVAFAYRWTRSTGMVSLGADYPGGGHLVVSAISDDGSVIVGHGFRSDVIGIEPIRWTAETGFVGLGDVSGGNFFGDARDVSADGSVVVGTVSTASGLAAFRWTGDSGIVPLPGDGYQSTSAYGVSADGAVIAGGGSPSKNSFELAQWSGSSWTGLGDLPGGRLYGQPWGISADGSLIVGAGYTEDGIDAIAWSASLGLISMRDFLAHNGVTGLAGWRLTNAFAASADGRTIVGEGINPVGETEAWIATIPKAGDANFDDATDGADYTVWADHFLKTGQAWSTGDFTGDGVVDGADYTVWADNFAPAQLSLSAVPEPSALALAASGALALAVTSARRRFA